MKHVELRSTLLAGVEHTLRGQEILQQMNANDLLVLRRQPENKYDQWAIGVYYADDRNRKLIQVGWIPRAANNLFAKMMDGGLTLYARLANDGDPLNTWIDIYWEREETEKEKAQTVVKHTKNQAKRRGLAV